MTFLQFGPLHHCFIIIVVYLLIYLISVSSQIILYVVSDKYLLLFHCWWLTLTIKSREVFNARQPYLLLQGGFSNGYFLYDNDTFDINKQGVVSLRTDVTLDRETKDSYLLEVQTLCCTTWLHFLSPGFSLFHWKTLHTFLEDAAPKHATFYIFKGTWRNKTSSDTYTLMCCLTAFTVLFKV